MRYLDGAHTAVLRTGQRDWTCTGHTVFVNTQGPIHWQSQRVGASQIGAHPSVARWTEHAPDCPGQLPAGTDHVEDLGETPPYQSGPRYSVACAARYVFGESIDATRARIVRAGRAS